MKYMGSKNRHAKELLPILLKNRTPSQWYVEPFVGGCNMIDKVSGNRIGNDVHSHLIAMWKALQEGWLPPENITEREYNTIKGDRDGPPLALVGFVGFGCSYSGKWWGGYARGSTNKGLPRNYCGESRRNVLKQVPSIKGVNFECLNYRELEIPPKSIIYCDPPYQHTTKYKGAFDHDAFWVWCKHQVQKGHSVFVSEYRAPVEWIAVWQKEVNNTLTADTGSKRGVEKLFVLPCFSEIVGEG